MHKFCLILILLGGQALAAPKCPEYRRLFGLVDVSKKSWETSNVSKKSTAICGELPLPTEVNLEVTVIKGKKTFTTKIYQPLEERVEYPGKNKNWEGEGHALEKLSLDTFVPEWYSGATLKVTELSSKKVIAEGKL